MVYVSRIYVILSLCLSLQLRLCMCFFVCGCVWFFCLGLHGICPVCCAGTMACNGCTLCVYLCAIIGCLHFCSRVLQVLLSLCPSPSLSEVHFRLPVSMPSRRCNASSFASTRGSAAAAAAAEDGLGLQPSVPAPPLDERDAIWAGWCPRVFERLSAMSPLALGGEGDELMLARRTQATKDDLPSFCRDSCPAALFDVLPSVEVLPAVAVNPPEGAVVQGLGEVNYSLVYDMPLPVILCRRRFSMCAFAEDGKSSTRTKHWPVRSDIERAFPRAIFVSRQCVVTMAFVEWLDRRRRLRLNLRALNTEIVSRYMDALIEKLREHGELAPFTPEYVLHLAPSAYVMRLVSDRALDCFVPSYFEEHLRLARQIDGACLRLDAEFKMAKKIRTHVFLPSASSGKRFKVESPFKCTLACRGVRGLFLAPLTPSRSYETGDAYVQFLVPLLRQRRETCEHDAEQGRPIMIAFDNGPAYEKFALAAVGEVWPQAVYGRDQPPCHTPAKSRQHSSLILGAVDVVSDPPHRRWHWQKALPCEHPDYWLFDQCLAFALARISAPASVLERAILQTDAHGRGYDEDAAVLRQLSALRRSDAMEACVKKASPAVRLRLETLLRSHDVRSHGLFKRVFGCYPPNMVLGLWAAALGVNPHPDVALHAYAAADDFASDVRRIAAWFSQPRCSEKAVPRKPEEDGACSAGSRISGPLLAGANVKSFLDMLQEPMLSSLLRGGDVHRRFAALGLRVPTGTTMVEQGFGAVSRLVFEKSAKLVSEGTFRRHAMLAVLVLNFAVLRHQEMSFLGSKDKRVLQLLEAAWSRLRLASGRCLSSSGAAADHRFRAFVASQQDAPDVAPANATETDPLLPLQTEGISSSE